MAQLLLDGLPRLEHTDQDDLAATLVTLESLGLPDAERPPGAHVYLSYEAEQAWKATAAWVRARYAELGAR
jgi:hypothetical protein